MKNILVFALMLVVSVGVSKTNDKSLKAERKAKVVILAAENNIHSEHFTTSMIANEMMIDSDSVSNVVNRSVINSLTSQNVNFIAAPDNVDNIDMALSETLSDYVLVIEKYDFDRRIKPMSTIFHHIYYKLYDNKGNVVFNSVNYFTTISLGDVKTLEPMLKKCTKKISNTIEARLK